MCATRLAAALVTDQPAKGSRVPGETFFRFDAVGRSRYKLGRNWRSSGFGGAGELVAEIISGTFQGQ
jgi:hypothetical protein